MRQNILLSLVILLSLSGLALSQTNQVQVTPPIPQHLVEQVQRAGHPFLLAQSEQYNKARSLIHGELFLKRGKHFVFRADGFMDAKTSWHLGEGPFRQGDNFHPIVLPPTDLLFYCKTVCEVLILSGIEQEEWTRAGLKRECTRLLDEIESQMISPKGIFSQPDFTYQQGCLFALDTMIYDSIFYLMDAKARTPYNNRFRNLRDRVSLFCNSKTFRNLPPQQRLIQASGFGLSTLLCISFYPKDRDGITAASSLLPDLYRAAQLTRDSMKDIVRENGQITCTFDELELATVLSTPWIESMKSFGYPYVLNPDGYTNLVNSLETHRVKETKNLIDPNSIKDSNDPWVPLTVPISIPDDPGLYPSDSITAPVNVRRITKKDIGLEEEPAIEQPAAPPMPKSENIDTTGASQNDGHRLTLKEQLIKFGYPRATPTPAPPIPIKNIPNLEAGWTRPKKVTLPSVLGILYLEAAKENPTSKIAQFWNDELLPEYAHPYLFLYFKLILTANAPSEGTKSVISYPDTRFTLYSADTARESSLFASQSAKDTLVCSTYTISHESFVLEESQTEWRWFHDIQSATLENAREIVASSSSELINHDSTETVTLPEKTVTAPTPPPAQSEITINNATSPVLISPMFSAWTTASPFGETLVVRKGTGGIGSPYYVIAHKPLSPDNNLTVKNIVFSTAYEAEMMNDEETPGFMAIVPAAAKKYRKPSSIEEMKTMRQAERAGLIKPIHFGILHFLFAPDVLQTTEPGNGLIGPTSEARLTDPSKPFFYLTILNQPGREMFQVKYGSIPMPGMRIIEWRQGLDLILYSPGEKTKNPFLDTDAEFALISYDKDMKGLFYVMVKGSYLRVKFSPVQEEYTLLADTKGQKVTCSWSERRIHLLEPPKAASVFYAPGLAGFECPNTMIKYGVKRRQAVILGHTPSSK